MFNSLQLIQKERRVELKYSQTQIARTTTDVVMESRIMSCNWKGGSKRLIGLHYLERVCQAQQSVPNVDKDDDDSIISSDEFFIGTMDNTAV